MRRLALLTVLAFGCATVREPVPPPAAGLEGGPTAAIEPDLELWMEGTGPIDAGEASRARAAAVAALSQAIAGSGLEGAAGNDRLLVRARAVVRTDERKRAQVLSVIGIVVTVVGVVIAVVVGTRGRPSSRPTSRAAVPAPPRLGGPGRAPGPVVPLRPGPYAPELLPRRHVGPPPFALDLHLWMAFPLAEAPPPAEQPVPWTMPSDEWIASRGWFDGDELELMLTLVDARTGAIRWTSTVREHVDPRDAGAVSRLLARAAADRPFEGRTP